MADSLGLGITVAIKDQFSKKGKDISGSMKEMKGSAEQTTGSLNKLQSAMSAAANVAIFAAAKSAFTSVIEPAAQYEKQMARVNSLMEGSSINLKEASEGVKNLSLQFGTSPTEQAEALFQAMDDGIDDASDALLALNAANTLATTNAIPLQTATKGIIDVMNAYQMEASEAAKVANQLHLTNILGVTSVEELSRFMNRTAPDAARLGVSFTELSAIIATLTKGGKNSRKTMMEINQVIQEMLQPNEKLNAYWKSLGVTSASAAVKTYGLVDVLSALSDSVGGNEQKLTELGISGAALQTTLRLAKEEAKTFGENLKKMGSDTDTLPNQFEKVSDSALKHYSKFQAAWTNFKTEVGGQLIAALKPLLKSISDISKKALEWIKEHPKLVRLIAVGLGVFTALAMAIAGVSAAMTILNLVMSPWLIIIAAVGAAITLVIVYWDELKAAASTALSWIGDKLGWVYDKLKNGITVAVQWVSDKLGWLHERWVEFTNSPIFQEIKEVFKAAFEPIIVLFQETWNLIVKMKDALLEFISSVPLLSSAFEAIGDVGGALGKIGGGIKDGGKWVGSKVGGLFSSSTEQTGKVVDEAKAAELSSGLMKDLQNLNSTIAKSTTQSPQQQSLAPAAPEVVSQEARQNIPLAAVKNPNVTVTPPVNNIQINVPKATITPSDVYIDKNKIGKISYDMRTLETVRTTG